MIRLVTTGRFTQDYVKAFVGAPEDREPVVRKLVESVGGKMIAFYFTTGEDDFMLIAEANDAESLVASIMAAGSAGMITDTNTRRAWTPAEFKAVGEKAKKASYRAPGKH